MIRWRLVFFFKQKATYEMRISDWSSDVCSSDLEQRRTQRLSNWVIPIGWLLIGYLSLDLERLSIEADRIVVAALSGGEAAPRDQFGEHSQIGGRYALIDHPLHGVRHPQARQRRQFAVKSGSIAEAGIGRSEEHTSELQSLMRISYAV